MPIQAPCTGFRDHAQRVSRNPRFAPPRLLAALLVVLLLPPAATRAQSIDSSVTVTHDLSLGNRYPSAQAGTLSSAFADDSLAFQRTSPPDSAEPGPHAGRLWLVGGTMAAGNIGIMGYYFATFYNDDYNQRAPFHTFNDWYNADVNVDKLGHIWGSQTYTHALYHLFRWTGMREAPSMYWSSGLSLLYQFEMEVVDGLYAKWGFSWWDMAANAVGAAWPNVQRVYPFLQVVDLKMSYHPSAAVKSGWVEHDYLRDYDGFTYWLALNVHDVLPATLRDYWPRWLGIALGYGANRTLLGKNVYNSIDGVGQGEQEWYLALDFNARALPGDTPFLRFLRESLNLFHHPMPAVRISPEAIWYGLYF